MLKNVIFEWSQQMNVDVCAGNEDKEKAFDMPTVTMGYENGLRRVGLPEEWLLLDGKMFEQTDTMVRHAYGYTDPFKRGGEQGCGNSCAQGGKHGALNFKNGADGAWR